MQQGQNFRWGFSDKGDTQKNGFKETAADGGKNKSKRSQHIITSMRRMGYCNGLPDNFKARNHPIDCIFEAPGDRSDIFWTGDDDSIGNRYEFQKLGYR